jgi:methylated-DNA-[protein]-cysteine S-methyltransferase
MSATATAAWTRWESPIGGLTLVNADGGLAAVHFPGGPERLDPAARDDDALARPAAQLAAYFAAERRGFALPLAPRRGTELELGVWSALERIPYGETVSYGELAERVGHAGDHERVREVAAIVGRTPTPIVVPCHRVIGADGSLTGYGGGIERKRALLDLERRAAAGLPHQPPWEFRQPTLI